MKVTIGFHFIEKNDAHGDSILNQLNRTGLTVDGNALEHACDTTDGRRVIRAWTEGTLEQFHDAADLLIAISNGGPVMFVASELTEQQLDLLEMIALDFEIEFSDGAIADNEMFAYCEEADHIRLLSNNLS